MSIFLLIVADMMMLIYTKRTTNRKRLPLCLCLFQFLTSAVLSSLILLISNYRTGKKREQGLARLLLPTPLLARVIPLSLCWALGFIFFNLSASLMSPAYVYIVRCLEPLATVMVGFLLLRKRYDFRVLLTLVPICGGVILASVSGGEHPKSSISSPAVLLACLSNVGFCFRSIFLHQMKRHPVAIRSRPNDLLVFFNVVLIACLVLPFAVLTLEGESIIEAIVNYENFGNGELFAFLVDSLLSSVSFFVYQFLQIQVMSTLSPLAFSILTPVIKVIMMVSCSWYFRDPFGILNAVGVLITTGGGYLFTTIKAAAGATANNKESRQRKILPL